MANNETQTKVANIIGTTFISTKDGYDPEHDVNGLLPNTLYFRISVGDGTYNYISAGNITQSLNKLTTSVESKASNTALKVLENNLSDCGDTLNGRISDLQSQLNEKIDKSDYDDFVGCGDCDASNDIAELRNTINNKVEISAFDEFKDDVIDSLTGDDSIFGGFEIKLDATSNEISKLKKDIDALKKTSDGLSDTSAIDAINKQIALLESKLNEKLTVLDLTPINNSIDRLNKNIVSVNANINNVNNSLNAKADQISVEQKFDLVDDNLLELQSEIDKKVDVDMLSTKASKGELTSLTDKVNNLSKTVNDDINNIKKGCKELSSTIKTKANANEVNVELSGIKTTLTTKADKAETNSQIHGLGNRVTRLETQHKDVVDELDNLQCSIADLKTDITGTNVYFTGITNAHANELTNINTQIGALTQKDREITETLKNEWIRVMTPAEYNNLPKNPYYTDGRVNPNALQPNVIYFLMKYNKPYALYIGSVLIAKVEEKIGSTGFTYSFPIVF